jgi:uncharacterized spore protein YtfJ
VDGNDKEKGGLFSRLAATLGAPVGAETVYGAAVTQGDVTVIPVATAKWGFGGGGGDAGPRKDQKDASGSQGYGEGGGGGVSIKPVGYIEIRGGETRFRRIPNPAAMAAFVLAGALGLTMTLRSVRHLLRRNRKR